METPLIKITEKIYAKLETHQKTGSVKDRMVSYIVKQAYDSRKIMPGFTEFIEATSGNTGIALASAAASFSCPCTIIMPENMSEQRKVMMRAFGAKILEVGKNDFEGAIDLRNRIIKKSQNQNPISIWCPYQFQNKLNVECHYKITAPEIHNQAASLGLNWEIFVHGAGTGGTMMGIKKYIDDNKLPVKCVLTMPYEDASSHGIQGINDGADFLLNRSKMDNFVSIRTEEAIDRMKMFARESGYLVGISSGANILAAETYVESFKPQGIVITVLCDRGERYL